MLSWHYPCLAVRIRKTVETFATATVKNFRQEILHVHIMSTLRYMQREWHPGSLDHDAPMKSVERQPLHCVQAVAALHDLSNESYPPSCVRSPTQVRFVEAGQHSRS